MPEEIENCPDIPVTDQTITPAEISEAIKSVKPDKSGGPSGIPPGVLKALPISWVLFLSVLFNYIFQNVLIPSQWALSRLIVIYKKGGRMDCGNYRGISIMDTLAKLYDTILCNRLMQWFQPKREQAGAQKGRGCMEHIVSLRLLIDYALCRKAKLYITYVDFSKAYDLVPRRALIKALNDLGCGYMMVSAIAALYSDTKLVLGIAMILATLGVRQGSPSSCFLFTLYIDKLVRDLHEMIVSLVGFTPCY